MISFYSDPKYCTLTPNIVSNHLSMGIKDSDPLIFNWIAI